VPSLRLRMASTWLPEWEVRSELERVSQLTTNALISLLSGTAPVSTPSVTPALRPLVGSIDDCRAAMASNHNLLVDSLIDVVGERDAISLGRRALYSIGLSIGEETRTRLGVGDGMEDLIIAARVLYRVLGITFLVRASNDEFVMVVQRCALSNWYSERTCKVLSATDEGVIRGLNPRVGMRFGQTITSGCPTCLARIWVESGGATG